MSGKCLAWLNDIVGDQVVKNPGKPTLVVDTDKRPRITNTPSAAQVFNTNGGN